jgi:hypothetical protein
MRGAPDFHPTVPNNAVPAEYNDDAVCRSWGESNMFTAEDVKTRLKQQPFVPVRIITSGGERYDVYHPDLVMVGRRYLVVGTASEDNLTIFEKTSMVSVLHISALENLPTPAAPQGPGKNGPQ